jgi:hypothetical protein
VEIGWDPWGTLPHFLPQDHDDSLPSDPVSSQSSRKFRFPQLRYTRLMDEAFGDIGDGPGSRRARTRGIVRGEIEGLLLEIRNAREAAQRDDAMQLDRLAAVLPAARAAGLSFEQMAELSGASRPTLNRLREPPRAGWSDAELAVLLVLALGGSQTKPQIEGTARTLGLDGGRDLAAAAGSLVARGLLASFGAAGYEGKFDTFFRLTREGEQAIRPRLAHIGIDPAFRWGVYFGVAGQGTEALTRAGEALLGTHEVILIAPGTADNASAEVCFHVRAASRNEAVEEGRKKLAAICREAGLTPGEVTLTVLALEPRLLPD